MSTVSLSHARGTSERAEASTTRARGRSPQALAIALLLVILYAAFSHGAVALSSDTRVQLAIAVLAALAAAAWLWPGTLCLSAPLPALAGAGLLFAFAAWSGATVLWSVAPDQTWIECNRVLTYAIFVCLAISLGSSSDRSAERIAVGFLAVALAVVVYALGQKLVPGLHLAGLFNLNVGGPLPRLQEPFGYWNALALFLVIAVPVALVLTADRARPGPARLVALAALVLLLITLTLTYSRGGLLALAVALAVVIALSAQWLRLLMWLAVASVGLIPPLAFALTSHALTSANVALGSREGAGAILLVLVLTPIAALVIGARRLQALERTVVIAAAQERRIRKALVGAVGVLVVIGLLALALSSRGPFGTISHAWQSFTTTRATSTYEPTRLLSADSENRWVWWKEAAGAFSDRPLTGWGAGSFGVLHLLYRRDTLSVTQPHSVPLQFLSETGVIGTLLALAAFGLLLAAGVRAVRRHAAGTGRMLAAALLAGAAAYAFHALYDWDWDIPGVTLPALAFLGVLVGSPRARLGRTPAGARAIGLAAVTLFICVFIASVALPRLAASKASAAVVEAAGSSRTALEQALADARTANGLDPLSDSGLKVLGTIAIRRGQYRQAQGYLLEATRREPTDAAAWRLLALAELYLGNGRATLAVAGRVLELDPLGQYSRRFATGLAQAAEVLIAPPKDSATARPLSP